MNSPVYELRDVIKLYGQREVLHLDHLEIPRGEITCIVGPNGAGKSSLLRLLNFLESPTSGQISFDGRLLNGKVPLSLRRRVTMVFQRPILLSGSVRDNVAYGLKLRGEKEIDARIEQVLERVGLSQFARASVKTLSGGEAQRVALARAIVIEPEALLLDEPTANLDPYNGSLIEKIVSELNRERGITIAVVTHNVFQAKRLAHQVAFLLGGREIEVAPAEQFFSTPTDPRTAAFVRGEMVY